MSACRGSCRTCSLSTCSAFGESGSKLLVLCLSMCTAFAICMYQQADGCPFCLFVSQAELLDAVGVHALLFCECCRNLEFLEGQLEAHHSAQRSKMDAADR